MTPSENLSDEPVVFIVNPHAGAGKAARRKGDLESAIGRHFSAATIRLTEGPAHAVDLAAEAQASGAALVVAVGGDGTCHEVVNGLCPPTSTEPASSRLGLLPFGTGSDLQRTLGMSSDLNEAMDALVKGQDRVVDVGLASFKGPTGPQRETFINVAGFGINGDVVKRANQMDKRIGGTLTFFIATLRSSLRYVPPMVRLTWTTPEGEHTRELDVMSCFIANAEWCGGGMWVGRGGAMDDGLLNVSVLPPDPIPVQVVRTRFLYNGALGDWPGVRQFQTSSLKVEAIDRSAPVWIDLDGEMPGQLPAEFSTHPRRLTVRASWNPKKS